MRTKLTAVKGHDYDMHTDSLYDVPECPICDIPLFDIEEDDVGNTVRCACCGKEISIPDEDWVREYLAQNTGYKEEEATCPKCGGTMIQYLFKRVGKWQVGGGECQKCGMRFIV